MATAPHPPSVWYRYVDDTFVKIGTHYLQEFTNHINSQNRYIKFTVEFDKDGQLPFLDTCVNINDDGSTHVTVYRKPTHTDQYLNFDSNHHLEHKRSVVRTLLNRVDQLVTTEDEKLKETSHVKQALQANGYKEWTFNIKKKPPTNNTNNKMKEHNISVPIPYVHGVSEKLTNIFRNHGVGTYHKPFNTIRSQIVHPKDKTPDVNKCGVVYEISCPECEHNYVGETGRPMHVRLKEHRSQNDPMTAIGEHISKRGHYINEEQVTILAREDNWWRRKIRESIEIRTRLPTLNRDQGYDLPRIYDQLLSHDPAPAEVM